MSQAKQRTVFNFNELTQESLPQMKAKVAEPVVKSSVKGKNRFDFNVQTKDAAPLRKEPVVERIVPEVVTIVPSLPLQSINSEKLEEDTSEQVQISPPSQSKLKCRQLVSDIWQWQGYGLIDEQQAFSEEMLEGLLRGQSQKKMGQLQKQVDAQKNKHVFARASTFITFVGGQSDCLQERVRSLIEWIDQLAVSCKFPLGFDKLPDKMGLIAEGRGDELAREYMARGLWDQALLLTSMNDQLAVEATIGSCTNAQLRKLVNFLQMKQVKYLNKTSWIAELSLVLRCCYFSGNTTKADLSKYIKDIYCRYIVSLPLLGCELISLMLEFQGGQRVVADSHVLQFVEKSKQRFKDLNWAQLLFLIKSKKSEFPLSIKNILYRILQRHQNHGHLVLLFQSVNLTTPEEIRQAFDFYRKTNDKKRQVNEDLLARSIRESTIRSRSWEVLYNWVVCREIQQLQERGEHFEFLRRFVEEGEEVRKACIIPIEKLMKRLEDTLTTFQLACSYKQHRRNEYFKLLLPLQSFLKTLSVDVTVPSNLIEGCLALIKIREGAFTLRSDLPSLHWLVEYITSARDIILHSEPFLQYIRNTVSQRMLGPDGALFIREICARSDDESGREDRKLLREDIKDVKGGIREEFAESQVYQLLQVVGWNRTVRGDILIHLHHE